MSIRYPYFNDVKHWRDRAEEARILADQMHDAYAQEQMRLIADDYDKLTDRAGERLSYERP